MEAQKKKDIIKKCESWIKSKNVYSVSIFGAGFAGFQFIHLKKWIRMNVLF